MNSKIYIVLALIVGLAIGYFATSSELFKGFIFLSPSRSTSVEKAGFGFVTDEVSQPQMINTNNLNNSDLESGSIGKRNRGLTQ